MQTNAANPNVAKIFRYGKWSAWLPKDVAAKLERDYLWGSKMPKKGIVPLHVAKEFEQN